MHQILLLNNRITQNSQVLIHKLLRQIRIVAANAPKDVNICRTFCAKITFMGENLLDKQTG